MIIWLASYPKSGNTWIRALLSNYLNFNNNISAFENIKSIPKFPNASQFDWILDSKKLNDPYEMSKYWISAQTRINLKNNFNLLKTHNFAGSLKGNWFTNSENTAGFIYIVRDPRSVAVSLKYHNNYKDYDQSINAILNPNLTFLPDHEKVVEVRGSWNIHYNSWMQREYPMLVIRYEDLIINTEKFFRKILSFLNKFTKIEINDEKILRVIDKCSFQNLSNQERKSGFFEKEGNENFFRKGTIDEWKNKLTNDQIQLINKNFKEEMKKLNYL